MRKTTITAAALVMTASVAGLAYAAAPDGRSTEDSSVVTPFSPATGSSTSTSSPSTSSTTTSSTTSEPASSTASSTASPTGIDDRGRGGHGADDGVATSTPSMPTGTHQRHDGSDDGPGHDVGDDHGGDRGGDHGGDRGGEDSAGHGSGGTDNSGSGSDD
ncbi:hypothetical protein E4P38_22005 [Blastococcus sp. CT_GayMR16]|nr:hypothetical protein E4P38_22005 [Blastococcus sp. CT_GayMR16]